MAWATRLILNAGFMLAASLASAAQDATPSCLRPGTARALVSLIDQNLELVLADGRRLQIAGVEVPRNRDLADQARNALNQWLVGSEVRVTTLSAQPDRWGRIAAHVHGGSAQGADVLAAFALVDAGMARVRLHPEAVDCLPVLLKAEQVARSSRAGLWGRPDSAVLNANRASAWPQGSGETVIVEGRVFSINATRNRTYINFGPARNVDLAVTIPRQTVRLFAGQDLKSLRGKMVRVRGLLERRPGPQIEVAMPQAIESVKGRPVTTGRLP